MHRILRCIQLDPKFPDTPLFCRGAGGLQSAFFASSAFLSTRPPIVMMKRKCRSMSYT